MIPDSNQNRSADLYNFEAQLQYPAVSDLNKSSI